MGAIGATGATVIYEADADRLPADRSPLLARMAGGDCAAEEQIQQTLDEFAARGISWTASTFAPGQLIRDFATYDPTECMAYARGVAVTTAAASSLPWPETLGGMRVEITDAAGVLWPAPLTFVSPGQVNYLLPAKARMVREDGPGPAGYVLVQAVSPGLFTVSQNARGPVIGIAGSGESGHRVSHCEEDACTAVPIAIEAEPVALALFGAGRPGEPGTRPGAPRYGRDGPDPDRGRPAG